MRGCVKSIEVGGKIVNGDEGNGSNKVGQRTVASLAIRRGHPALPETEAGVSHCVEGALASVGALVRPSHILQTNKQTKQIHKIKSAVLHSPLLKNKIGEKRRKRNGPKHIGSCRRTRRRMGRRWHTGRGASTAGLRPRRRIRCSRAPRRSKCTLRSCLRDEKTKINIRFRIDERNVREG